ncbi:hypothetical protein ARMSODRAFT_1078069, partial [Armillaria solidipes]
MFASIPTDKSRFDAELVAFAPPSQIEEEGLLSMGDAVVADIDRQIKATKDALEFLVKERDQAISNITDARPLLHSSRKLNEDVLR